MKSRMFLSLAATVARGVRRVTAEWASALIVFALVGVAGAAPVKSLVLYDTTGPYWQGNEIYAQFAANLCGHFGAVTSRPVASYTGGYMTNFTAVVYVGATYDEPLPQAFLTDVLSGKRPVIWMQNNIWQLTAADPAFSTKYGWMWREYDYSTVTQVVYKGKTLTRHPLNSSGLMDYSTLNTNIVRVLATAIRSDGTAIPWAIRSGKLTYLGELPFPYMTETDRYLIFADLLFDALAPTTAVRKRALVRIEDVGPDADPVELRAIADYFKSKSVPFSVAVYTRYEDPYGVYSGGVPISLPLRNAPSVISALKYMAARGGTLLAHGYTHQYANVANPYDGASGDDFEFYMAHVDANDNVIYDGPVPEDSPAWVDARLLATLQEFTACRLTKPTIFEFPHYAGSTLDYLMVKARFAARYERSLYVPGLLSGLPLDYSRMSGQFFPYTVTDVCGAKIIPENLGNYEPDWFNQHPPRLPADIINAAAKNLVVRDATASFFYHPYLGVPALKTIVEGIQALGYKFVAPASY